MICDLNTLTWCDIVLSFFRESEMRNSILAQVLDQSARARRKFAFRSILYSVKLSQSHLKTHMRSLSFQ